MMQVLENQDVELTIRCKAFSGEGVRLNRVLVEPGRDGAVLVWDSVAGHYTTCHSLSAKTQDRIRSQAVRMWYLNFQYGV
jgi:hypothetical protein